MSVGFNTALASMASYLGRPTLGGDGSMDAGYHGWSPGHPDGGFGMAEPSLSSMLGIGNRCEGSRSFLRFGHVNGIVEGVLGQVREQSKANDQVTPLLQGAVTCMAPSCNQVYTVPSTPAVEGGSTNNTTTDIGGADEAEDPDEAAAKADELSDQHVANAAKDLAAKLDLGQYEAAELANRIQENAGGSKKAFDAAIAEFNALPPREPSAEELGKVEGEEKKQELRDQFDAAWQRAFGPLYAKHAGGVDAMHAGDVGEEALFRAGNAAGGNKKFTIERDKGGLKNANLERYKVKDAEEGSGFAKDQFIYFNRASKSWVKADGKTAIDSKLLPKPEAKEDNGVQHALGSQDPAVDDAFAVTRQGLVEIGTGEKKRTYDAYGVGEATGETATALKAKLGTTLYVDADGKFYQKDGDEAKALETKGAFSLDRGRVVFKRAARDEVAHPRVKASKLGELLDRGIALHDKRVEAGEKDLKASVDERLKKFEAAWEKDFSETGMECTVQGDELVFTPKSTLATDGKAKAAAYFAQPENRAKLDAFFKDLPPSAKATVGDEHILPHRSASSAFMTVVEEASSAEKKVETPQTPSSTAENDAGTGATAGKERQELNLRNTFAIGVSANSLKDILLKKIDGKLRDKVWTKPDTIDLGLVQGIQNMTKKEFEEKVVAEIQKQYPGTKVVYSQKGAFKGEDLGTKQVAGSGKKPVPKTAKKANDTTPKKADDKAAPQAAKKDDVFPVDEFDPLGQTKSE